MENKENKTNNEKAGLKGELTFDDKVIQKIIGISLESIEGLLTVNGGFFSNIHDKFSNNHDVTAGIDVEVGKKQVAVDLEVVVEYGFEISKIYDNIKTVIEKQVKHMTNLEVTEVNVEVIDIKTSDEYEKDSVTVQDKVSEATSSVTEFVYDQTDKVKKATSKSAAKAKESKESRVE